MPNYISLKSTSILFGTDIEYVRNQTLDIFQEFILGSSVRQLAKRHNIPFETLRDRFYKFVGYDYKFYSGAEGSVINILKEYKEILSPKDYQNILSWYKQNSDNILQHNYNNRKSNLKIYSNKGIKNIENNQHYFEQDLRDCFFLS